MMSWERHVEYEEAYYDDGLPGDDVDDRDPQDYAMEEAELNSDFWDEQLLDEYLLQRAVEDAELHEIILKGEAE